MTTMPPAGELIDMFLVKALVEAQCLEAVVRVKVKVKVKVKVGARARARVVAVLVLDVRAGKEAETRREAEVVEATALPKRHKRNSTQRWPTTLVETARRLQSPLTSKMRLLLQHLQPHSPKHKLRPTTLT
jgi:uncharacterized Fe-S center protein